MILTHFADHFRIYPPVEIVSHYDTRTVPVAVYKQSPEQAYGFFILQSRHIASDIFDKLHNSVCEPSKSDALSLAARKIPQDISTELLMAYFKKAVVVALLERNQGGKRGIPLFEPLY